VGAKRVALDTIESLFAALPNEAVLRSELAAAVSGGSRTADRRSVGDR